jgi:hypothetical protein
VLGGKFFCFRQKAKELFLTQPKSIANETFSYRSVSLTDADKQYLEGIINKAPDERLRDLNRDWVNYFTKSFDFRLMIEGGNFSSEQRIEVERELHRIEKTLGEMYHTRIENRSKEILDSLRNQDDSFYQDIGKCVCFIIFICNQYFRTAKMRQAVTGIASPIDGHDPRRTNLIESFIYATNVGASLIPERESYAIFFLVNNTSTPYITGDQPIINLLDPTKTTDIKFYYPLSPVLAILFTKNDQKIFPKKRCVSAFEVETYNYEVYRKSDDQVYSNNEEYLRALVSIQKDVLS